MHYRSKVISLAHRESEFQNKVTALKIVHLYPVTNNKTFICCVKSWDIKTRIVGLTSNHFYFYFFPVLSALSRTLWLRWIREMENKAVDLKRVYIYADKWRLGVAITRRCAILKPGCEHRQSSCCWELGPIKDAEPERWHHARFQASVSKQRVQSHQRTKTKQAPLG